MGTFTTRMVWDGSRDGHWDVVLTEMTEGCARLLAKMTFDEWIGLATQEAIANSVAGEGTVPIAAEDVERLIPPVGRIGD